MFIIQIIMCVVACFRIKSVIPAVIFVGLLGFSFALGFLGLITTGTVVLVTLLDWGVLVLFVVQAIKGVDNRPT